MTDKNINIARNSLNLALNHDGSVPDEVQLIPSGHIIGRDGRNFVLQNVDEVIDNSIQRFNPSGKSQELDLVIDYEHQTELSEKNGAPAPAAGWIKRLFAKEDGLWGKIEWTKKAAEHITNKEYRYLSPVFLHDKQGNISKLLNAGLTNVPNLELKAFNSTNYNEEENKVDLLKQLCILLGLSENSSEEDVVKAIEALKASCNNDDPEADPNTTTAEAAAALENALKKIAETVGADTTDAEAIIEAMNKQVTNPAKFVPMEQYMALNKRLTTLESNMSEEKALTAVNKAIAEGCLPPAMKTNALAIYKQMGEKAYNDFVSKFPKVAMNRATASTPAPAYLNADLDEDDKTLCKQLNISEAEYKKTIKEGNNA